MVDAVNVIEIHSDKANVCREVLEDLPEWFGIPESTQTYIADSENMPMFVCYSEQEPTGFISLKMHNQFSAELYVLGVKRRFHRQGIGKALVDAALQFANREKMRFLTVKTLASSHPDPHYAGTRKFYEKVEFLPVEVFPTLWGAENPCLLMVKVL